MALLNKASNEKLLYILVNNNNYNNMLQEATLDTGNFNKIRKNKPSTFQAKFNSMIGSISNKYKDLTSDLYKKLNNCKCSDPLPNSTYGLPKDHKQGTLKCRPIVSALNGPTHKLSKFLVSLLKPLLKYIPAHIIDGDQFYNFINAVDTRDIKYFGSFDVINLYGSIPLDTTDLINGAIDVVSNFYREHINLMNVNEYLTENDFKTLISHCLKDDYIIFNGEYYQQTTGLAMGNPISPLVAIIYMNNIEIKISEHYGNHLVWRRYIDDIFFIVYDDSCTVDNLFNYINGINPLIQFTKDNPVNDKLVFLDMVLTLNRQTNHFDTCLYIKECHSGTILNFYSSVPNHVKYGIVIGEYRRALHRSNNNYNIIISLNMVIKRFINNSYPIDFLITSLRKFINKLNNTTVEHVNRNIIYIKMPFINDFYTNKINHITRNLGLNDKVKFYYKTKNLTNIFLKKEKLKCNTDCLFCSIAKRMDICNLKFVVYIIECGLCQRVYIGETKRLLKTRISEHFIDTNSAVFKHNSSEHPNTNIYNNFSFDALFSNAKSTKHLLYIESMYIRYYNSRLMNGVEGVYTSNNII